MRFQLLGPLTLADDTDSVVLQPSKPTILLAALLLHPNSVVSTDYLLRTIWGEAQPATAKAALHTCVLRLRRLFTQHRVTETTIEAVPGGYRITATADTLDLIGFREKVRRAATLAADPTADPEAELTLLREALAQWQGGWLLANVRSETLHRDEAPRLAEERLRAVERVCDLNLGLGRCGEALVELWTVTREHPSHERFREQLIEALYRTGRQAEALAEYQMIKTYLRDELGVDPSPTLRDLELAILRGHDLGPAAEGRGRLGPDRADRALPPAEPGGVADVDPVPALTGTILPRSGSTTEPLSVSASPSTAAPGPGTPHGAVQRNGGGNGNGNVNGGGNGNGGAANGGGERNGDRDGVGLGDGAPGEPWHWLAPTAAAGRSGTLPAVPGFAGREAEVEAIVGQLTGRGDGDRTGTVLLCGPPGIGKTALAHQVAHQVAEDFPDGCFLVRMVEPDGTPRTAAQAGAELSAIAALAAPSADSPDGPRGGRALLVLDDVVDADQVRPLLPAGPGGAVVVTSRMGLAGLVATHGGWVHRLGAFTPEESRALLVAVLGAERVAAEPEAARELAELCGHYPLALRIVSARLLTRPGLPLRDGVGWVADDPLARMYLTDDPRMSVARVLDDALDRLPTELADLFLLAGALPAGEFRAEDVDRALLRDTPADPGGRAGVEASGVTDRTDRTGATDRADATGATGASQQSGTTEGTDGPDWGDTETALERLADAGLLEEGPPGPYRVHALLRSYARRTPYRSRPRQRV